MTIATAIFLIAIGAILRYAITVEVDVIDIQTVGLILMIAGGEVGEPLPCASRRDSLVHVSSLSRVPRLRRSR